MLRPVKEKQRLPPMSQWKVAPETPRQPQAQGSTAKWPSWLVPALLVLVPLLIPLVSRMMPKVQIVQELPAPIVAEQPRAVAQELPKSAAEVPRPQIQIARPQPVLAPTQVPIPTVVPLEEWQLAIAVFFWTGQGEAEAEMAVRAYQEYDPEGARTEGQAMVAGLDQIHYPYPNMELLWRYAVAASWLADDATVPDRLWERLGKEKAEAEAKAKAEANSQPQPQPTAVPTTMPAPTSPLSKPKPQTTTAPTVAPTTMPTMAKPTVLPKIEVGTLVGVSPLFISKVAGDTAQWRVLKIATVGGFTAAYITRQEAPFVTTWVLGKKLGTVNVGDLILPGLILP